MTPPTPATTGTRTAPLCACGCGRPCTESRRFPGTYTRYVNATHRKHASRRQRGESAPPMRPPTHCACGCGTRLPPYKGRGKYLRFLPTHYQPPARQAETLRAAPIPGDLTPQQIDAIITHHKRVLRYERNTRP